MAHRAEVWSLLFEDVFFIWCNLLSLMELKVLDFKGVPLFGNLLPRLDDSFRQAVPPVGPCRRLATLPALASGWPVVASDVSMG